MRGRMGWLSPLHDRSTCATVDSRRHRAPNPGRRAFVANVHQVVILVFSPTKRVKKCFVEIIW